MGISAAEMSGRADAPLRDAPMFPGSMNDAPSQRISGHEDPLSVSGCCLRESISLSLLARIPQESFQENRSSLPPILRRDAPVGFCSAYAREAAVVGGECCPKGG